METDSEHLTNKFVETGASETTSGDVLWEANHLQTEGSTTHLEDDQGVGDPAVIRLFEFAVNPDAFSKHLPTTQELFNYHHKGIETLLWRDGLKVIPEVNPRVTFNKKKTRYRIFVGAKPMRGHLLMEQPKTLSQIIHT